MADFISRVGLSFLDLLLLRDPTTRWRIETVRARTNNATLALDLRADAFMKLAYFYIEQDDNADVQSYFQEARALYEQAVAAMPAQPQADRGPTPRTKLSILLFAPLYDQHDFSVAYSMCIQAYKDGCPHAGYWIGRALFNGFGVAKDTRKGFEYLLEAAQKGVSRAKYETALLFEEGFQGEKDHIIRKHPTLAREYFRSIVVSAAAQEQAHVNEWDLEYVISYLFNSDMLLDKEDTMGLQVGSLLSWEFAGQAFLFGAAAQCSGTSCSELLSQLLPILGIAVGILSFISSTSAHLKNSSRRNDLSSMFTAKVEACNMLVPASHRPWSHLYGVFRVQLQSTLGSLSDWAAVALSLLFIGAWSALEWDVKHN
jgi:hypothetical protein